MPLQRDVRDLKRTVSRLNRAVTAIEKIASQRAGEGPQQLCSLQASDDEVSRARLSPALIRKLRSRLGLTQVQVAGLLGVTGAAVAQWESGASTPSDGNRATLIALRKLGRRDVQRLLAEKGIPPAKRRNRTGGTKSRTKSAAT
jgi:DNA-binding transcriptional regulator YiaG